MRRSVGVVVGAVGLIAGLSAAVPAGAAVAQDDTQTVCAAAQETVQNGLETFVGQMNEVSQLAQSGDLEGAEAGVQAAGDTLTGIAEQLREDSADAEDARLKETVTELAAEFDRLGGQLDDLTGLQDFDTTRLDELGDEMTEQCGGAPSEDPLPSDLPQPSPTGGAGAGGTVGPKASRTQ
jgi:hypothetical protein